MSFQAIPRGGLFVLGFLSYFLDLTPDQLLPRDGRPCVLVDDCSISGARFWRFSRQATGPFVFAHLLSHPSLRAQVELDPNVLGCVAAADLRDLAPGYYVAPGAYEAWQQRCAERLGEGRYWIGIPEPVAFPWTEPDTILWNPESGQPESGWRLVSPDRCLKNRQLLEIPALPAVRRELRVPDTVAFQVAGEGINLCDLRTERCYGLQGTAALLWRALAAYGNLEAAAAYLAGEYVLTFEEALADTGRFAGQLQTLDLLEPLTSAPLSAR